MILNNGKNDFGIHAVFKTREYYMLKIKSGHDKAKLPPNVSLQVLDQKYQPYEKRKGFTKIHLKPDSNEAEIIIVMDYFKFLYGK
jgi:hypothetical protein